MYDGVGHSQDKNGGTDVAGGGGGGSGPRSSAVLLLERFGEGDVIAGSSVFLLLL
jgi:hypothetical protein